MGGIFMQSGLLMISFLMLRSAVFNKVTAIVGMLTYGLDLTHILIGMFASEIGVALMVVAGCLYPVWFILVGRRLIQMGKTSHTKSVNI